MVMVAYSFLEAKRTRFRGEEQHKEREKKNSFLCFINLLISTIIIIIKIINFILKKFPPHNLY